MTNDKNGKEARKEVEGNPAECAGKVNRIKINIKGEKRTVRPAE